LRMRANREWAMVKKIKSMRLAPADATATHPIVALCEVAYGSIEQGHEEMGMCCIQVMERCDGDLFSILSCRQAPLGMRFSEPLARWLFRQILRGVKLMADNGVYHRDLKVENILIKNDIHVKLADFGTGTDLQRTKTATDIGTLSNNPFWDPMRGGTDGYDAEKWDVFQCGVVLFHMFAVDILAKQSLWADNGKKVWKTRLYAGGTKTFMDQCEEQRDPLGTPINIDFWERFPVDISDEAKHFLNAMLDPNPEMRPSLRELLQHSWLLPHQDDLDEEGALAAVRAKKGL